MPVKKYSVEQIIAKLREVEKLTGQGMSIPMAAKNVGVTDQTFHRWRTRGPGLARPAVVRRRLEQSSERVASHDRGGVPSADPRPAAEVGRRPAEAGR